MSTADQPMNWIYSVEVKPRPTTTVPEGAVGAWVTAVVFATAPEDLLNRLAKALDEQGSSRLVWLNST
jgi:hypothetical protein